jgi:integrase
LKWIPREVPWIDGAEELMARIRAKLYRGDDNAHVFANIGLYGLKHALPRAIKKCELQKKLEGFTQHKIRHLFGTKCAEADVKCKHLAEYLGQSDGGVLAATRYSHVRVEVSRDEARNVSYRKKSPRATGTQQSTSASSNSTSLQMELKLNN